MRCPELDKENKILNIGNVSPYIRSLLCHKSICKPIFSLGNADASYQCHYSILVFTVSVVLMSMNP